MIEPETRARYERQLRAMIRAAGQDDPEHLAAVVELLSWAVRDGLREAVESLRTQEGAAGGFSWAEIGAALGTTRQAAHERFGSRSSAAASDLVDAHYQGLHDGENRRQFCSECER